LVKAVRQGRIPSKQGRAKARYTAPEQFRHHFFSRRSPVHRLEQAGHGYPWIFGGFVFQRQKGSTISMSGQWYAFDCRAETNEYATGVTSSVSSNARDCRAAVSYKM